MQTLDRDRVPMKFDTTSEVDRDLDHNPDPENNLPCKHLIAMAIPLKFDPTSEVGGDPDRILDPDIMCRVNT